MYILPAQRCSMIEDGLFRRNILNGELWSKKKKYILDKSNIINKIQRILKGCI